MIILEDFDYLSPKITLYHYGRKKHSSKFGGLLTITFFSICTTYIVLYLEDIFTHHTLSLYYYKKYEYEAGEYYLDNKGIFHFIRFYNNNGYFEKYEQKYIRIIISNVTDMYPKNNNTLIQNDHWIYDLCENGIDNKNIEKNLFDKIDNYTNSACIKYYYNSKDGNYYNKTSNKFIYPSIAHGNSRKDNLYQGLIIEKCKNNSIINKILGPCGTKEEIENYVNINKKIYFSFIDHQIDPTNLNKPFQKFFNSISSYLNNITYPIHNMNFNPLILSTDKNLFGISYHRESELIFDINKKDNQDNLSNEQILTKINFLLQNYFIIYDRSYRKLIEAMASIGGIVKFLHCIFYAINYMYNKYIMILNTKNIFLNIHTGRETKIDGEDEIKILAKENYDRKLKIISTVIKDKPNEIINLYPASADHSGLGSNIGAIIKKENFNKEIILNKNILNNKSHGCKKSESRSSENKSSSNISSCNNSNHNDFSSSSKSSKIILINEPVSYTITNLRKKNIHIRNNFDSEINNDLNKNNLKNKQGILRNLNFNTNFYGANRNICFDCLKDKYAISETKKNKAKLNTVKNYNDERYKGFKEDLKRFVNENKKKLLIPERNIKFIVNKFSFFNYLFSLCNKKKKINGIYILDIFRKKLISEEHLYRAHINLYSLEKYFGMEKEKVDILELYKNL